MNITREHLELAAKAAGYELDWETDKPNRVFLFRGNLKNYEPWQPDEDIADAAQLAEDCKMSIDFYGEWVDFSVDGFKYSVKFGPLSDNKETWMQAVTLAAAEIGRAMK